MNNRFVARRSGGFTLIEVMVAVAVIAVALPALMYSMVGQIDSSAYLRDKMQAQWVAENVMAQTRLNNRLGQQLKKSDSGKEDLAGRKWRWTMRSQAFPQPELKGVVGIEVEVFLDEQGVSEKDAQMLSKMVGVVYIKPVQPITVPAPEKYASSANGNNNDGDSP